MPAIDAWVNVDMPRPTAWQKDVAEKLFKKSADAMFRTVPADELVSLMDASEVERAILTIRGDRPNKDVLAYADKYPGRFSFAPMVDPRRGMATLRELEAVTKSHDVRSVRVIPSMISVAPDDRVFYPLYAKCIELGLPISVNVGIPGPKLPARFQDPLRLDEVCLFFPELVLIMANGADPWWDVAIRLMLKYENLYLMTSAFAPKYLPESLVHFMNTRGQDKIIFGTDFPFLTMERCIREASALDLRDGVLHKYLYANAQRVFFASEAESS